MQDWESILRRGFESKELDYKGPCAWDESDKKACCELVKDILAIANTKGGFVVVGVSEPATGFTWDGLADDQCKSFDTSRVNRFLQNYADPPINTHVIKHESRGANFVIIEIPRFPDTPHICQKDFPGVLAAGAIYVRTDNNESAPIRNSSDMRTIVEHATRNRADQLLASFRAVLTGTPPPGTVAEDMERFDAQAREAAAKSNKIIPGDMASLGFRETVFHPLKFDRLRFTMAELERMAEAASVAYRGWPYIFYTQKRADLIQHLDDALEMALNDREDFQFWRLYRSGCLYVCEMFHEDGRSRRGIQRSRAAEPLQKLERGVWPEPEPDKLLGDITFAYTCAEAVQCLVDLYTGRLADDETILMKMRLRGVQGRYMAFVRGNAFHSTPYECRDDQIEYEQQHSLADWRAGVLPHAVDLLNRVTEKFNAPPTSYDRAAPHMQRLLNRQL